MINQYQALLLIPLLNVYIPKNIRDFIIGNDITLASFSFLQLKNINSFISNLNKKLGGDQKNEYLSKIGVESNSVIMNLMNLFLVYLITFLLHMSIWLTTRLIKSRSINKESKWNKFMTKILDIFKFSLKELVLKLNQIIILNKNKWQQFQKFTTSKH